MAVELEAISRRLRAFDRCRIRPCPENAAPRQRAIAAMHPVSQRFLEELGLFAETEDVGVSFLERNCGLKNGTQSVVLGTAAPHDVGASEHSILAVKG